MKRILLATSIDAYLHQGGGEQELKNLHKELNKLGFLCDVYGCTSLDVDKYDVIIYVSLGNGINIFLDSIDCSNKTLILWPNFWLIEKPETQYLEFLQTQIDRFDAIVIKTKTELNHIREIFDLSRPDVIKVSNFIDERLINYNPSSVFQEVYDLQDYALWMGIIEPQKNQLEVIRAMKNSNVPLVISGAVRDKEYFEKCMSEANGTNDIIFLPPMHYMSELHLSALANCSFYIENPLDFPGNSSIEAAFLNNNLYLTDCLWSREIFNDNVKFISSDNIETLDFDYKEKVFINTLVSSPNSYLPEIALSKLVNFIRNC